MYSVFELHLSKQIKMIRLLYLFIFSFSFIDFFEVTLSDLTV